MLSATDRFITGALLHHSDQPGEGVLTSDTIRRDSLTLLESNYGVVDGRTEAAVHGKSALALRPEFEAHDATKVHEDILAKTPEVEEEARGCRCGDVLRGLIRSEQCPLFGKVCKPMNPMGPCMVSAEGNCSIAYRLGPKVN